MFISLIKKKKTTDILHILPSYDEYLISYKDRTDVLNKEYQHKAFNSFGIFRPVNSVQRANSWKLE